MARGGILLLLGLLAGCGQASTPPPIVIGHVANLGGGRQSPGEQAIMGIDLALAEANKDQQPKLKVIHTDAQHKVEAFKAEATRLLTINQAVALLGGSSPDEVLSIDRARPAAVERPALFRPLLAPSGWRNPALSDQVFFVGMSVQEQAEALVQFTLEELQVGSLAVLVDANGENYRARADAAVRTVAAAIEKKSGPAKLRPALTLSFGKDAKLDDQLTRIKNEKTQALVFAGSAADFKTLLPKLSGSSMQLFFAGPDGSLQPDDIPTGVSLYVASAFAVDAPDPSLQEFVQQFRKVNHVEPTVHAALAYASVRVLANALRKNPGFERLRDELRATKDFPGLAGPLSFNAKQQLLRPLFILKLDASGMKMQKKYQPDPVE